MPPTKLTYVNVLTPRILSHQSVYAHSPLAYSAHTSLRVNDVYQQHSDDIFCCQLLAKSHIDVVRMTCKLRSFYLSFCYCLRLLNSKFVVCIALCLHTLAVSYSCFSYESYNTIREWEKTCEWCFVVVS